MNLQTSTGHNISCAKELGAWTVRVNGRYVIDFPNKINATKAELSAMRVALRIVESLSDQPWPEAATAPTGVDADAE